MLSMTLKKTPLWNWNRVEPSSSSFDVEEIKKTLTSVLDFEDFKKITPRDLYHEPFDVLLSPEQRLFLMDMAIVDSRLATKEEKIETYPTFEDAPYPWINQKLDSLSVSRCVNQGRSQVEQDIPLYSEWFSKCHAVIIYTPHNCATMLLHVIGWDFDDYQVEPLKEFLKDGPWEAIFVYGSESRCLPHLGHEYLATLWCVSRNIFVSTWPYHRSLLYDQTKNKIFVGRKNSPHSDVLTFTWFSDSVYDREKRKTYDIENRMKKVELEALYLALWSSQYRKYGWYYSKDVFEEILSTMETILWRTFDRTQFIDYCVQNDIFMFTDQQVIIPEWFIYTEEKTKSIYERYGYSYNQVDYILKFLDYTADIYYKHLLIWLTKNGYHFLEWNRSNSLFIDTNNNKFILANSGEKVTFRFVKKRDFSQKKILIDTSLTFLDSWTEVKKNYIQCFSWYTDGTINNIIPYYLYKKKFTGNP